MIPCGEYSIVAVSGMGTDADFTLGDLFFAFFYWE